MTALTLATTTALTISAALTAGVASPPQRPVAAALSDPIAVGLLVAVAAICAVTDILRAKVYDVVTIPTMVLGFGLAAGGGPRDPLDHALAGWLVGLALLGVSVYVGGLGMGDAKLVMALGSLTDGLFALQMVLYGAVVASAMGLLGVIAAGEVGVSLRRLGAALGLARPPPPAPPRMLPGGFCLCLGTVWALLELSGRTTLWHVLTGR